jgi:hypothetical protein
MNLVINVFVISFPLCYREKKKYEVYQTILGRVSEYVYLYSG